MRGRSELLAAMFCVLYGVASRSVVGSEADGVLSLRKSNSLLARA